MVRYGPLEVIKRVCSESGGRFLSTCEQLLIHAVARKELQSVVDLLLLCFNRLASCSANERRSLCARAAGFLYLIEVASRAFRSLDCSKWESFFDKNTAAPLQRAATPTTSPVSPPAIDEKSTAEAVEAVALLSAWVTTSPSKLVDIFEDVERSMEGIRGTTPFSLGNDGRFDACRCFLFSLSWKVLAPCLRLLLAVETLHGPRAGAGAGLLLLYECLRERRAAIARGVFRVLQIMAEEEVDDGRHSPITAPSVSLSLSVSMTSIEGPESHAAFGESSEERLTRWEKYRLTETIVLAVTRAAADLLSRRDYRGLLAIASSIPPIQLKRPVDVSELLDKLPLSGHWDVEEVRRLFTALRITESDMPDILEEIERHEKNLDPLIADNHSDMSRGRKRLSKFTAFLIDLGPSAHHIALNLAAVSLDVENLVSLLHCSILQERREKAEELLRRIEDVSMWVLNILSNRGSGKSSQTTMTVTASVEDIAHRAFGRLEKLIKFEGALQDSP